MSLVHSINNGMISRDISDCEPPNEDTGADAQSHDFFDKQNKLHPLIIHEYRLEEGYKEARVRVRRLEEEYRADPSEAALNRIREANTEANRCYGEYAEFVLKKWSDDTKREE